MPMTNEDPRAAGEHGTGDPRDTDKVADRTHTERHGDDVDEAARRSSGFDLDEREGDDGSSRDR